MRSTRRDWERSLSRTPTGHIFLVIATELEGVDNAHPQKVHAVQDTFEPGSVVITVGAALEPSITLTSVSQVPTAESRTRAARSRTSISMVVSR